MAVGNFIFESIYLDDQCVVDKEAGVIRNVRVLGPSSPNCHEIPGVTKGTKYTRSAMESEIKLLDGAPVYTDHPDRRNPAADRKGDDAFGILEKNRVATGKDGDEIRGDLPYYKTHPMAPRVIEDVERKIGNFALSHNAVTGRATVQEGYYVVETIEEVRSCDLVTRGATNRNLWESKEPTRKTMKTSLRLILESFKAKKKFGPYAKFLLEGMDAPALDAETETGAADHETALDDGMIGAAKAVLDDYKAGSLDVGECLKKIGQITKAHAKIKGGKDTEEEMEKDPITKEDTSKDEKDTKEKCESLTRKNAVLGLLIESGKKATPLQIKALESLPTDKDRKELLESFGIAPKSGAKSGVPNERPAGNQINESKRMTPEECAKLMND